MWTLKAQQPICWNTQVKRSYLQAVQSVCLQHFHLHPSIILLQQLCIKSYIASLRNGHKRVLHKTQVDGQESYLRWCIFKESQLFKKKVENTPILRTSRKALNALQKSVCFEKRFHAGSTKAHSTAGWLPAGMCSCLQFLSKKAMIKTNNMYIYIF